MDLWRGESSLMELAPGRSRWSPPAGDCRLTSDLPYIQDHLLLELVQKFGHDWKFICYQHYPTRSRNDVKNRYVLATDSEPIPPCSTSHRAAPRPHYDHPAHLCLPTTRFLRC